MKYVFSMRESIKSEAASYWEEMKDKVQVNYFDLKKIIILF